MKLLIKVRLFGIAIMAMLVVGCEEQFDIYGIPSWYYIYLEGNDDLRNTDIAASAIDWTPTFTVFSSLPNAEILIHESVPWLTCTKIDNSNYSISADFNNSIDSRHGFVLIHTPEHELESYIEVSQSGRKIRIMNYEDDSYYYPHDYSHGITYAVGNAIDERFQIMADGDYDVLIDSTDNWFTFEFFHETNILHVIAPKNQTANKKEGKLIFTLLGLPSDQKYIHEWTITQKPQ